MTGTRSIEDMMKEFDGIISTWRDNQDEPVTDEQIQEVNQLSAALDADKGKYKKERETVRNKLIDVINARRNSVHSMNLMVDDPSAVLKARIEKTRNFCIALQALDAVKGVGSGSTGKKHVMELLETTISSADANLQMTDEVLFYYAASSGFIGLVNGLIAAKSNDREALSKLVNYQDPTKHYTPLIVATIRGHGDVVGALVAVDCVDVNARLDHALNRTALQDAVLATRPDIVACLLTRDDIDLFHKDKQGYDAINMAFTNNEMDAAELIRDKIRVRANEALNQMGGLYEKLNGELTPESAAHLIQSFNEATRCLGLDEFKKERAQIRQQIIEILDQKTQALIEDKKANFDSLYPQLRILTQFRDDLSVIQKSGSVRLVKKRAMTVIDKLIDGLRNRLLDSITDIHDSPNLAHAIFCLAKYIGNPPSNMSALMRSYFISEKPEEITEARSAMACLDTDLRKFVKDKLFEYVQMVASQYQSHLSANDAWINDIKQKCQGEIKPTVLFEIFRTGDSEKVDHNTGTWKKFVELMKTGNFLKEAPAKKARFGGIFSKESKGKGSSTTELQDLKKIKK